MAGTPGTKLLILCSAAVGAVYAGAYLYTEPSAHASQSATGAVGSTLPSTSSPTSSPSSGTSPSSSPSTSATSSSNKTGQTAKYKDGTYSGSGSNAYGTLSAEVTISGGKITAVRITSYNMHYPQSYIDPQMTNEFIQSQTYRVYAVSGATASSYNFAEAVYYALQKAKV